MTGFSTLFNLLINHKNGGSLSLIAILDDYIKFLVQDIYCSEGDLLDFHSKNIVRNIILAWILI